MTKNQQAIILVSIIGTILSEYDDSETTPLIADLKLCCSKFMNKESGMALLPKVGPVVVNYKKNEEFVRSIQIGDKIWRTALDKYAKKKITIDAISTIMALYEFSPSLLASSVHLTRKKMDKFVASGAEGDEATKLNGVAVGGYLSEILAKEMGIKINGRLKALKAKVERDIKAAL